MAITNGYCTLNELKLALGRSDTVKDSFLEVCVERASRYIDNDTDRFYFSRALTDEYIDIYGFSPSGLFIRGGSIYAPAPFQTVTTLASGVNTLALNTDYYVYRNRLDLTSLNSDRRAYKFTGSLGYATTPLHINQACLTIAEVFSGLGIRTVVDDGGNEIDIVKNSLPLWVKDLLAKERLAVC